MSEAQTRPIREQILEMCRVYSVNAKSGYVIPARVDRLKQVIQGRHGLRMSVLEEDLKPLTMDQLKFLRKDIDKVISGE